MFLEQGAKLGDTGRVCSIIRCLGRAGDRGCQIEDAAVQVWRDMGRHGLVA
jgi:hypothetical protein